MHCGAFQRKLPQGDFSAQQRQQGHMDLQPSGRQQRIARRGDGLYPLYPQSQRETQPQDINL